MHTVTPPPEHGRWVTEDDRVFWGGGTMASRVALGDLAFELSLDRVFAVEGVLLPDGTRGTVRSEMPSPLVRKVPYSLDGRWIWRTAARFHHGTLVVIKPSIPYDLRFVPEPLPSPRVLGVRSSDAAPDMEADLLASDVIRDRVQHEEFAAALYASMCNQDWVRHGKVWSCTWRYAGGIVANLRDRGEAYTDYYCGGNEGFVDPSVAACLLELGWTPVVE